MVDPLMDGLDALRLRGMSFVVHNNRLRVEPKHAYKSLSESEREFLKRNRSALKAAVQRGLRPLAATVAATEGHDSQRHNETQSTLPLAELEAERAARIRAAQDAYIKQHDPETWRVLHFNDPDEIARRNQEATDAMNSPFQPPIHNW